ncbi:MAG: hypothetical protein CMP61_09440 [Flavobacteriales bacterium]|nr:hypothetical protein [Flavobacteriales bacterium]
MKSVRVNYNMGAETIDLIFRGETYLGEQRIFLLNTIHGGGHNFQNDTTRIFFEVRFWSNVNKL